MYPCITHKNFPAVSFPRKTNESAMVSYLRDGPIYYIRYNVYHTSLARDVNM